MTNKNGKSRAVSYNRIPLKIEIKLKNLLEKLQNEIPKYLRQNEVRELKLPNVI
jgi:hypothetical protein